MFANSHQSGFLSIFYSVGSNPLALWDKQVKNGHIRRIIDDEVKSLVLDIGGTNVATTYITCPLQPRASLGIKLPFLVMIIKNMKKYFSFEIQILDDKDMRRRFRVSNFQSTTKVRPFCTTMPIGLSSGWNQVQFNLADFTKRAYGSQYMETVRVQIHANVRIRRIYFTDQLHNDEDLPNEFKLFAPSALNVTKKAAPTKGRSKEAVAATAEKVPSKEKQEVEEEVPPPPTPAEETAREGEPEEIPVIDEYPMLDSATPRVGDEPPPPETPEAVSAPPEETGVITEAVEVTPGEPVDTEAPAEEAAPTAVESEGPGEAETAVPEAEAAPIDEIREEVVETTAVEGGVVEEPPPPEEVPAEPVVEVVTESEPPSEPPTDAEPPTEGEEA